MLKELTHFIRILKLIFLVHAVVNLSAASAEIVRPIEITVIDSMTMKPVPEVMVEYVLMTAGLRHFLGIPRIDPMIYRDRITQRFFTDDKGLVSIGKVKIRLGLYEKLYEERIHINCESYFENGIEKLRNPIDLFHGVFLTTTACSLKITDKNWERFSYANGICVDLRVLENSLNYVNEKVTVILKRKASANCGDCNCSD